jgi:hypothetical protein
LTSPPDRTPRYDAFPRYSARAGAEITIEERVNSCMTRSMNGRAIPRDAPDMAAFVAYAAHGAERNDVNRAITCSSSIASISFFGLFPLMNLSIIPTSSVCRPCACIDELIEKAQEEVWITCSESRM